MSLDPGFTTPAMQRVFSPETRVGLFCRFEAALARAQAALGVVPEAAAAAIAEACSGPVADPAALLERGWEVGTPVLVLLEELESRLPEEHADHLHRGATTQDVTDTALMLQSGSALSLVEGSLALAASRLARLADEHRATAALGRTFLQAAVPTTLGARAALWLQSVVNVRREITDLRHDLPVQLGGPVGDMGSFGESAYSVAASLAEELGLVAPPTPWHTDRWPVQGIAALLGRTAAVYSKIATDVALLAAQGEIRVRAGRSSSMAHKANPVDAMRAEASAEVCRSAVTGLIAAPAHHLERGLGPWQAEWALVPLAFQAAGAAAEAIVRCLDTLEVDVDHMTAIAGDVETRDNGLIDRVLEAHRSLEKGS